MNNHRLTKAGDGMGEIFSQINRLAHQLAIQEEPKLRAAILTKVREAKDKGATIADLKGLLSKLELMESRELWLR